MAKKKETKRGSKLKEAQKPSNYLQTARAKKTPGRTVKPGGVQVMKEEGKTPLAFRKGGLHKSLNVPQGQKIPAAKMKKALSGTLGKEAKKQALFAKNVLAKGRRTAQQK